MRLLYDLTNAILQITSGMEFAQTASCCYLILQISYRYKLMQRCHLFLSPYLLQVWASKWNERAYISSRKAKLNHDSICMAMLIQEIICADYAFVIHIKNSLSGDTSEIYTEVLLSLMKVLGST